MYGVAERLLSGNALRIMNTVEGSA